AKAADWIKQEKEATILHQFASNAQFNKKYISPDGRHEVIFDDNDNLVRDPRNMGTFNYNPPDNVLGHIWNDVVPYFLHGNGPKDTTWAPQRIIKSLEGLKMPHNYLMTDPNR
ncbi:MAG: hypothetical protein JKY84_06025, partial [Emcibacteraceae bacterium]|nr:hypothetical protein [Emcibacteraceae bacterium]